MEQWKLALVMGSLALGGVVVGAQVFGAESASAQQVVSYRQCFFARQESVDVDDHGVVANPENGRMIGIPHGWDVVAGGGEEGFRGAILLCRR